MRPSSGGRRRRYVKPDTRQHEEHGGGDAQLTRSAAGDTAAFTPLVEA
jgi:hypothetical protein